MPAGRRPGRRSGRPVIAWCLFDWAASPFNTIVGTFVFPVYYARAIHGDATAGSAAWATAIGLAGIATAILAPVCGAIADRGGGRGGGRKHWLGILVAVTIGGTALLWWARPDPAFGLFTLVTVGIAMVAFELAMVFYNAMLSGVAPPGKLGRVSGRAWGLGYMGGLAALGLALVGFVQPEQPWFGLGRDEAAHIRGTAWLVAIWFAVFALPLFLWVPAPATGRPVPVAGAIAAGLGGLWRTVRALPGQPALLRFLIASALYRDGLATLFAVGGLYAAGSFGLGTTQVLLFGIGLNVTAGLGAAAFGVLDDRLGSRPTILLGLGGLLATGLPLLLIRDATAFMALGLALGVFVGPVQAASRSLLARLARPAQQTEMFGLYAFTGKSIAFAGPLAFATVTAITGSQRQGMATVVAFLLAGLLLLLTVRDGGNR